MEFIRTFKYFIILIGLIIGLTDIVSKANSPKDKLPPAMAVTVDELANICEAMESAIFDVAVEYETYNDPPPKLQEIAGTNMGILKGRAKHVWSTARPFVQSDPNQLKGALLWLSKSTKKVTIVNEHGDSWDSEITQSYDGEVTKRHQLDGWPNKLSRGMITKKQDFMSDRSATPLGFTVLRFKEKPLSERLRQKDFVRLDNTIKPANGFKTIHVDLFVHWKDKEILSKRVYFSVDHGFTPVKIEYFSGKGNVALAVEVFELEKVAEALWFPKKGWLTPSVPGSRTYIYEASNIVVNQGLTKEYFDIDFPMGTKVRDEIRDLEYVVGE